MMQPDGWHLTLAATCPHNTCKQNAALCPESGFNCGWQLAAVPHLQVTLRLTFGGDVTHDKALASQPGILVHGAQVELALHMSSMVNQR